MAAKLVKAPRRETAFSKTTFIFSSKTSSKEIRNGYFEYVNL